MAQDWFFGVTRTDTWMFVCHSLHLHSCDVRKYQVQIKLLNLFDTIDWSYYIMWTMKDYLVFLWWFFMIYIILYI